MATTLTIPWSTRWGCPCHPRVFNWLLWVGLPLLLACVSAAGYWGGRRGLSRVPIGAGSLGDSGVPTSPHPTAPGSDSPDDASEAEVEPEVIEPVKEPVPTLLEAVLVRPAEDLPDVWGVGEEVQVACTLSDDEAQGVRGAGVTVTIGESGEPVHLVTGDDGRCSTSTVAESSGTYPAAVEFSGDDESYLASLAHSGV